MNTSGKETQTNKPRMSGTSKRKDRASEIANTFEWLITAFILAFVFRAFVMEAFRIPTGSMADTLMGAHFQLCCPECGYEYAHGFMPFQYTQERLPADTIPPGPVPLPVVRCPSCGHTQYHQPYDPLKVPVANGDRILVLKCLYQFVEPKRWDVIVFKNPINPAENYIKRLIGLPGEEIEIVDGDVYINGYIARKSFMVQREHWMPVYDHDYQPIHPSDRTFNGTDWSSPFDTTDTLWSVPEGDPTRFHLDGPPDQVSSLRYGAPSANDFRTTYAYNNVHTYTQMPECSDLKLRFLVHTQAPFGKIGVALTKYGITYRAWLDLEGRLVMAKVTDDNEIILQQRSLERPLSDDLAFFSFAYVDHRLILEYGHHRLITDLNGDRDGVDRRYRQNGIEIFGAGRLALSHVALYRDTFYTGEQPYGHMNSRATEGRPFRLQNDEFFVLGDNSPNSEDARWWKKPTLTTRGQQPPRAGVVPRNYLVGKAMFVYWPSGYAFPWPAPVQQLTGQLGQKAGPFRFLRSLVDLRWIPNVGRMRFIYGGAEQDMGPQ